ncbi:MBL fold metallo-hydrolase [Flavobacterium sp. Fl-318]|uniref:MBL fold metallo-hydrolase n=1 Tax=Flavobacterium cupriresistens TaxID=2893885 RepID=A0ABU4RG98_9FLAO|nr:MULTISPECIES: MBL fold metallo-hydrolase [unclassified Flavobacterium]MDX6191616.1 MBL fold metallo-hydrolase [Flavobacterium sp. Fl-318]UFH41563.1 MBL fold metallo-hydrolase [Flavobacterium sp. F-323]
MIYVQLFEVTNGVFKNQCYLVHNQYEGVLIDPAWDYELITNYIEENGILLKGVLLTHGHLDHIDLAGKFSKEKNVSVWSSDIDAITFRLTYSKLQSVSHLKSFKIGTIEITPILTPGHTSGSVCYLIDNHVFSGDTVFIEGVGVCSEDGAASLYDSVQFLKNYLPEHSQFWPGHSYGEAPGKSISYLMIYNIYFQFISKKSFIAFRTRKNQHKILEWTFNKKIDDRFSR